MHSWQKPLYSYFSVLFSRMASHLHTGNSGEELATAFLQEKGFHILERNWRFGHWEVDIIASLDDCLHFVEVKTRKSTLYGLPEDDVSRKKLTAIINAAEQYQIMYPEWQRIQFDIVSILLKKGQAPEIFFIEDVYV